MVVQSIPCVNSIPVPISSPIRGGGGGELEPQVDSSSKQQDIVVSEVVTKCKISIQYNTKKSVNIEEQEDDVNKDSVKKAAPTSERRCSARIQDKLKNEKVLLLRKRANLLDGVDNSGGGRKKKKTKVYQRRKKNFENAVVGKMETHNAAAVVVVVVDDGLKLINPGSREDGENGVVGESVSGNVIEKSIHAKVKETLRTFNKYYLHLVQEEETRCKKAEVDCKTTRGLKIKVCSI